MRLLHTTRILWFAFHIFSRSECGNLQWNYPYPQDVHEPMQLGERWPAHCDPESDCLRPTTPILGPEDPRYKHLVQISSVFIVTQNRYRAPNNSPTSRDNTAIRHSNYLQPFQQQSSRVDYTQTTLVMPNLEEALNLLAVWVSNEWPGSRIEIKRSYVPNCQHLSFDMLHCEGRAADIKLFADYDEEKYGIVAWMATKAGFSFVHRESRFSIHLSIGFQSPVRRSEMDPGCFPRNALVSLADGKQARLESLTSGDKILTWDPRAGVMETKLISWLHSNRNSTMYFLEVQHEHGFFAATPDHLIYLYNGKAIYTGLLSVGAQLRYVSENGSVLATNVLTIRGYRDDGYYAPLTADGTVLINGIYFSNFGVISKPIFGYIATSWARYELFTPFVSDEFVELFASRLFLVSEYFFPMLFF